MNGTAVMTALACQAFARADYLLKLATRITALNMPKPAQITFESGTPFIKADRLDRACSIWEVMESDPTAATSISLLYNLGVCQEALVPENPSAALEYYVKADQLTIKPDKLVSAALLRAKEMVENQKKIGS